MKQPYKKLSLKKEKAYETTWKYSIKSDLQDLRLKGRMPSFIWPFWKAYIYIFTRYHVNLKKPGTSCPTREHPA